MTVQMNVTERDIARVNDSLERCASRSAFLDRFYELFLASSPQVRAKFNGTDFKLQKRMLLDSFYLLLRAASGDKEAVEHLALRARRHSRADLDIAAPLYALWLECLLQTVSEFDARATDEVMSSWRRLMQMGIDFMVSRY